MANQEGEGNLAVEGDEDAVDEKHEQPIEFDEQTHKMDQSVHTGSTSAISHTLKKLDVASNNTHDPTANPWSRSSKLAVELAYLQKKFDAERVRKERL